MSRQHTGRAAGIAALLAATLVPGAGGADSAPSLGSQAQQLRERSGVLESRADAALLDLYALESRLARARASVERLRARRTALERERAGVRRHTALTERVLTLSQERLGALVRALYEQGETDPLAILLGAESLEAALDGLDSISRAAEENREVIDQASRARVRLAGLKRRLAAREGELARLLAGAEAVATEIAAARAERADYVTRLAGERRLTASQLRSLETRASAAQARTAELQGPAPTHSPLATPTVAVTLPAPAPGGGRIMTVSSTGYALPGTTATGIPVGWGVVAVDPSVIPLGSRMTIPGYGEGVAADTGGAVKGAIIDLWFPTTAQALQWGRRVVTITVH